MIESIRAYNIRPGMKLQMLRWFKQNDRRPINVTVSYMEGRQYTFKATLVDVNGHEYHAHYNGKHVVVTIGDKEVRVTFKIERDYNPLFCIDADSVILADKNGETALWNILDIGLFQLPDDECCDSMHTANELMEQGYTIAR